MSDHHFDRFDIAFVLAGAGLGWALAGLYPVLALDAPGLWFILPGWALVIASRVVGRDRP